MKYIITFITLSLFTSSLFAQGITGIDIYYENSQTFDLNKVEKSNMITQSLSQIIDPVTSVSCNNGSGIHYENSYYRVFDLFGYFNLNSNCIIDSIEIAIALANSGTGDEQPIFINFHGLSTFDEDDSAIKNDSLVLLADTIFTTVSDNETGNHKMINVIDERVVKVVKGKYLVIEIGLPYYEGDNHSLFLGSNNLGETGKTFIKAPHTSCDIVEPTAIEELLFDMHLILNVYWEYENPKPEIFSFNVEGQINETVIVNEPDYRIEVVMDADTTLTNITPFIEIPAGFKISPVSGSSQDFSSGPISYQVDNNFSKVSQTWDAYVVNAGPDIIWASLSEANGEIIIDKNNHTVTIPVNIGTNLTALNPSFGLYPDFEINPQTEQDFSSGPVVYTVSHQTLSLTQDWDVYINETVTGIYNNIYKEINLYPNPFKGYLYIQEIKPLKTEVYNLSGKLVLIGNENIINMSSFPDGIYFIKIFTKDYIYTDKLILRK